MKYLKFKYLYQNMIHVRIVLSNVPIYPYASNYFQYITSSPHQNLLITRVPVIAVCPQYPGPCRRGGGTSVTRRHPARTPAPDPHSRTAGAGRCDNHQRFWLVRDLVLPKQVFSSQNHLPSDFHLKHGYSLLNICNSHICFGCKEAFLC